MPEMPGAHICLKILQTEVGHPKKTQHNTWAPGNFEPTAKTLSFLLSDRTGMH